MSSNFGHKERKTKRQNNLNFDITHAAQIIEAAWKEKIYNPDNIVDFFKLVIFKFESDLKTAAGLIKARELLLQHVRTINQNVTDKFPLPMVPIYIERAKPTKGLDWLIKGREVANLAEQAMELWSKPHSYTPEDVLGWTLLSSILWGGLNDQAALRDLLNSLIENRPLRPFFQHLLIFPLDAEDSSYGNNPEEKNLKRSFSFIPDDVTKCWLVKLKTEIINFHTKPTVERLLNHVLKQLETDIRFVTNKSNQDLLKYANFHWELLPNVFLDQAISRVLTQDQKCCSLSAFEFANFYTPQILTRNESIHIDPELLFQVTFSNFKSGKNDSKVDNAACHVTSEIRKALKTQDPMNGLKSLEMIQTNESAKRLVGWISHLFESGELRNNSIERYMSAVAQPWLNHSCEEDINNYDEDDFEVLYQDIIEEKTATREAADSWLIPRFHQFQIDHYKAPKEVNFNIAKVKQICSASVVSPLVFKELIDALKSASGLNQQDKRTCLLVLILAFRTGMRRGEITGILFNDVEWGTELSFLVRNNDERYVKTSSAFRRIPVWALLKPDELRLLRSHLEDGWDACKKNKKASVFSVSNSMSSLRKALPSDLFKLIVDQILIKHDYSFHSLRHTAISNLSLILIARQDLVEHLTDYDIQDCERIRNALLGYQHIGQDKWYALAQVAGHLNPDHSFQHYIHFAHLMGGFELCQGNVEMPMAALEQITGYKKSQILRKTSNAFNQDYSIVTLSHIRPLLAKDLVSHTLDWKNLLPVPLECKPNAVDVGKLAKNELDKIDDQYFILPGSELSQISMQTVHTVLSKIEKGESIDHAVAGLPIDSGEVQLWIDRAKMLAALKTSRNSFRLFTDTRRKNHPNQLLVPTKPVSPLEQSLLAQFFIIACKVHKFEREGFHQFLDTFFEKVSTSRGEIRFTLREQEKLTAFLQVGEKLISIKHWRLRAQTLEEAEKLKNDMNLNSRLTISKTGSEPDSEGGDRNLIKYKGFSLSIIHPSEKDIQDRKNSQNEFPVTSGLLKYFCHMLAIADLSYVIKTGK